jgi:hypothetical protein
LGSWRRRKYDETTRRLAVSSFGGVVRARAPIWNTNEREITPIVMLSLLWDVYRNIILYQEKKCGLIERV